MAAIPQNDEVIARLREWAISLSSIRAVVVTSSLARPDGPVDVLTDYDIILFVTNAEEMAKDDSWISDYGSILVRWGDQSQENGFTTYFRGIIYDDFVKIDYSLWPDELLESISAQPSLPEELDAGYRVILDKDGRTAGWQPPTYRAYVPLRPTEAEYIEAIETFWWTTTYVAKSLWRDELVFSKFCLDYDIKLDVMRRMLEWRVEIEHDWSLRPGVLGRGLKRLLPPGIWVELENTYVGPEIEENWAALYRVIALFRRVAVEVGEALGYTYPAPLDEKMQGYLSFIRQLPQQNN